ncbi:MAG: 4'-phosphopantetheinyl transferase superfamily protein [Planktotalea sp.]|uniref:4'-phosphopantetheinyl transferase family protein n=1 Tax=Planktotalea sp. TaxID=2029877 RepID=UPI003C767B4E
MSLVAALEGFLPRTLAFAVRDPRQHYPLIGREAEAVANAIEKRKTEFSAGRDAARAALSGLGHNDIEILVGPYRAPIWPDGFCGSITHSREICIAGVARLADIASIGIDAERDMPLKDELRSAILHESELHVSGAEAIELFSMKEALFKALFPICGELMGFHAAKSDGNSGLVLTRQVGAYPEGSQFDVPTIHVSSHVISQCIIEGVKQ